MKFVRYITEPRFYIFVYVRCTRLKDANFSKKDLSFQQYMCMFLSGFGIVVVHSASGYFALYPRAEKIPEYVAMLRYEIYNTV